MRRVTRRERQVVQRHHDRPVAFARQIREQFQRTHLVRDVEMVGRLVQQHDFRVLREQRRERNAAALAAGERLHVAHRRIIHAHRGQRRAGLSARRRRFGMPARNVRVPALRAAISSAVAGNASTVSCGQEAQTLCATRAARTPRWACRRAWIAPAAGARSPARVCSSVVLPAPLGPMMTQHSPALDVEGDITTQRAARARPGARPRQARTGATYVLIGRSGAAARGTAARRRSAVSTPTGSCDGATSVRATVSANVSSAPSCECGGGQQPALVVADHQTHGVRNDEADEADAAGAP